LRLAEPAKPGIYFLSLDADSPAAAATRRSYRLPYFHSRISAGSAGEGFHLRLDEDVIRRLGSVFRRQVRAAGSADSDPRRIIGAMADGAQPLSGAGRRLEVLARIRR
jgi:uncharacterized protein YqjF (DUF2071 family)